mmetsp:Transcript_29977/g.54615  ORF Transcript_29977/g.54615 Transcript_29977/m.54615 type:complete len:141 (-) Transcript_29977:139-561(-)
MVRALIKDTASVTAQDTAIALTSCAWPDMPLMVSTSPCMPSMVHMPCRATVLPSTCLRKSQTEAMSHLWLGAIVQEPRSWQQPLRVSMLLLESVSSARSDTFGTWPGEVSFHFFAHLCRIHEWISQRDAAHRMLRYLQAS